MSSTPPASGAAEQVRSRTLRKITWRVIPILMVGYFISYVDRSNIGFAKTGLTETFGLSATAFGFASGIFYLGYILFEVPSNLLQHRFGARVWLTRIMLTWGIVAAATAFVTGPWGLYAARFLLGVAEAGFFPGVVIYLSRWYPNRERTRMISTLMMAIPLSSALAGPFNGWILDAFHGTLGLEGWRWLFLIGGLPACVVAVVFFVMLSNSPADARWLAPDERAWLESTIAAEEAQRREAAPLGHWEVFRNGRVLTLALIYFLIICASLPLTYWMPSAIEQLGNLSSTQTGLVTAVPFTIAALGMYVIGKKSSSERAPVKPLVLVLIASCLAFVLTAFTLETALVALLAITAATLATQSAKPLFWGLPTAYLSGAAAATGVALINSVGNVAGFVGPFAVGWIQDASGGSVALSMTVMIAADLLALLAVLVLTARMRRAKADRTATAHTIEAERTAS